MIKFFRLIRQKLIVEGRVTKYLLYAIGEIALVMIGILLALQVNNWNEKQGRIKTERAILVEMKENLKSDLQDIHGNITFDSTNNASTMKVLKHLENKAPFDDSLRAHYGRLGWASLFAENTSAFENLKSIGFNLISNKELRQRITFIYSSRYEYLNEILNTSNEFAFKNFRPSMINQTTSNSDNFFDRVPNDSNKLMGDIRFQELLREDIFLRQFCINLNRNVEVEVVELIALIDKELSK